MASDEARKKWGTIFMGEREASVEQLDAMQEPMRREKLRQEQTEDYMERVRKRAADRAREILGAAYTERLKVLDEARAEAEAQRRSAEREAHRLKGEGEALKKEAAAELEKARQIREEAEKLRAEARKDGLREGMEQAEGELREFRGELGRSLARVLAALRGERRKLVETWRQELCDLTCEASAAGAGYLLQKEHRAILTNLVLQALRQLENRSTITVRVNPQDESTVADMFQAARECVPDIRQWIVTPDENIEAGGFVAESGGGRVDCRRENFREMVDNILAHLALPILESEEESARAMRDIVDEEAARLAEFAPEALEITAEEPLDASSGDAGTGEMTAESMPETGGEEPAQAPFEAPEEEDLAAESAGTPENMPHQDAAEEAAASPNMDDAADNSPYSAAAEALAGYTPPDLPLEDEEELGEPVDLDAPPEPVQEVGLDAPTDASPDAPPDAGNSGEAPPLAGQPTLAELEDELFSLADDGKGQ